MASHHAPDTLERADTWRAKAACRTEDPELFFPIGNTGPAALQIKEAKAVCARCPVADKCLQWAVKHGQSFGVWGGLSEDERAAMKRRSARKRGTATCGTEAGAQRHRRADEPVCRACQLAARDAERRRRERREERRAKAAA